MHLLMKVPVAAALALFIFCGGSFAAGKGCEPLVSEGIPFEARQLFVKPSGAAPWSLLSFNSSQDFAGRRVRFLYVIGRDEPNDLQAGTIALKVQRLEAGVQDGNQVTLFRNSLPEYRECCSVLVDKETFQDYHGPNKTPDETLAGKFHVEYNGVRTDRPDQKRFSLAFEAPSISLNGLVENARAMIVYYTGINEENTCIPFYLNVSSRTKHLTISVVELDAPAESMDPYEPNVWDVSVPTTSQ